MFGLARTDKRSYKYRIKTQKIPEAVLQRSNFFDSHVKYISYNNLPKKKIDFFLLIETVAEKTTTEIKPHFTIKELRI